MARLHRLTVKEVERATKDLYDGGNLGLQVRGSSKSWVFRFMVDGRERYKGLGRFPDVTLAAARDAAAELRKLRANGGNPLAERDAERGPAQPEAGNGAPTFERAANRYIDDVKAGWKSPKSEQAWRNTLGTYAFKQIGSKPVDAITADDVAGVLRPIWSTKNETATRVRSCIELILGSCVARGECTGNPAVWSVQRHLLPKVRAEVEHHPALPWKELPAFMVDLRKREGDSARALELLILTACRTNEILGVSPEETRRGQYAPLRSRACCLKQKATAEGRAVRERRG